MSRHGIPFHGDRGDWFTTEDVARILLGLHGLKVYDCERCGMTGEDPEGPRKREPDDCKRCDGRGQYIDQREPA